MSDHLLMRLVRGGDLDGLHELAMQTGHGLTTLPAEEGLLRERIERSLAWETRLFVLEDVRSGRLLGTSGIVRQVGVGEPWYAFRREQLTHESEGLGIRQEVDVLHRYVERHGPSEIGTLFLSPNARRSGVGRFLSLARFLEMAERPERYQTGVIAELRGVVDSVGRSLFWDAVGRHFFAVDYTTADFRSAYDKQFIAELMPRHPVYLNLLPESARDVVGQVHEDTLPALRLLEQQGFEVTDLVDIFDAGPVLRCATAEIATVRASERFEVLSGEVDAGGERWMIAATEENFRAVLAVAEVGEAGLVVGADVMGRLGVDSGEAVRAARLYSSVRG
ncbi:MAG: arginine N-succinyltransferase [Phycisphaeraceae bacterium]